MTRSELERMARAGDIVADCRRGLARGRTILDEVFSGETGCEDWRHYPAGEVYDPASHAQFFYHVHPTGQRPAGEHGHFHTFLRAEGMPPGVAPLVLPEIAVAGTRLPPQAAPSSRGGKEEVCHLVAIALDGLGEPIRLFTTNRWVTGETWYPAADVIRMLDRFTVGQATGAALLNQWVTALVQLFSPQIAALLRNRDKAVTAWRQRRRGNVFENPRLETISSVEIDLDAQLAVLARLRSGGPMHVPPGLPQLAEGWGGEPAG